MNVFQTFPFPKLNSGLEKKGKEYYEHRYQLMLDRQEGLNATYNRFHNPDETAGEIAPLRELHVEMDAAVAVAYGWANLDLGHDSHDTPQGLRYIISEAARREVLGRLLELNHQRYEEEVKAGLHDKRKKKAKAKRPRCKGAGEQGRCERAARRRCRGWRMTRRSSWGCLGRSNSEKLHLSRFVARYGTHLAQN